ncbi:FliH/SctL family protein [Aestuariibius insulae]|uniref:FliH/SctL family protein n=1 Tax=Aestuariibius insulae TaxID=2058287 RepID=UPI00345EBC06
MSESKAFHAVRLSKEEVDQIYAANSTVTAAKSEADRIIADAKAKAQDVLRRAEATRKEQSELIRSISDDQLKKFMDQEAITRSAQAFAAALEQAADLRREFEALTPWLENFVESSVRRIIGTLSDAEVIARIVRQGVGDLQSDGGLALRIHPDDSDVTRAAMDEFPNHFEAIKEVCFDGSIAQGSLILNGGGGSVKIDLETQLSALTRWIKEQIPDEADRDSDTPK